MESKVEVLEGGEHTSCDKCYKSLDGKKVFTVESGDGMYCEDHRDEALA